MKYRHNGQQYSWLKNVGADESSCGNELPMTSCPPSKRSWVPGSTFTTLKDSACAGAVGRGRDSTSSAFIVSIVSLILYRLHKLVKLSELLIWTDIWISTFGIVNVDDCIPLILSIMPLSIFSPSHESPSIFWAYICHSVKKPIYYNDELAKRFNQCLRFRLQCAWGFRRSYVRETRFWYTRPQEFAFPLVDTFCAFGAIVCTVELEAVKPLELVWDLSSIRPP